MKLPIAYQVIGHPGYGILETFSPSHCFNTRPTNEQEAKVLKILNGKMIALTVRNVVKWLNLSFPLALVVLGVKSHFLCLFFCGDVLHKLGSK